MTKSQRDPRTVWISEDGLWAVIRGDALYDANGEPLEPPDGIDPDASISFGYLSELEARHHIVSDWVRRIQTPHHPFGGSHVRLWCRRKKQTSRACFYKIRLDELPWERGTIEEPSSIPSAKTISDYPKTCVLCGGSAYLGLNEVIHDPEALGSSGCQGLVHG